MLFKAYSLDNDGEWKPTGQTYQSVEDAVDDYGEENVRPIGDKGLVYALHEDDRGQGDTPDIMISE